MLKAMAVWDTEENERGRRYHARQEFLMGTLFAEAAAWVDSEECAQDIKDRFGDYMSADKELLFHRLYIVNSGYGMGESCFHWLWRLIVDIMPTFFRFLEIGVYKGQILSLVKLLANREHKFADVTGVTLLSDFAGDTGEFPKFEDVDYRERIEDLHDRYDLFQPRLVVGDSTAQETQAEVRKYGPFDIVYIDGCHEYNYVMKDLLGYSPMVRPGGLLVVDDCSSNLNMPKGFFKGIEPVSRAVRMVIETDPRWEHLLAVAHNRVWRMGAVLPADCKLRDNRKRNPA